MAGLTGMKEICKYTQRSEPTIIMLIRNCGFPARKIRGRWESDTELIEAWRRSWINGKKEKRKTRKGKKKRATAK